MDPQESHPLRAADDREPELEAKENEERSENPQLTRNTNQVTSCSKRTCKCERKSDVIHIIEQSEATPSLPRGISSWIPSIGAPVSLLAVILISFSHILIKVSTDTVNPIQVSIIFVLAQFMLSVMCAVVHSVNDERILRRRYTRREWIYLLTSGFFNGCGRILLIVAYKFMPVGDTVTVLRSMVVFAGIMGWIFLKQALRFIDFPFILSCIAGVVLIARPTFLFPGQEGEYVDQKLLGTLLTLGSAACLAASFCIGKKLSDSKIQPYIVIIISACVALPLTVVLWAFERSWDCADYYVTISILAGGALTSSAHILIFWAVSREKVVVVTVILASNIIFVYVLQVLIIHVIPSLLSGVGAVLILTACIGMSIRQNGRRGD